MARVTALYRYPIKGFTAEGCNSLTVLDEGRIAGDRTLAFRFANSGLPESAWSKKYGFAVLVNAPGLARLTTQVDHERRRVRVTLDGRLLIDDSLDDGGRERIAAAIEQFVLSLPENPLAGHPARLPLELIGDGITPRYQDNERDQITLHSRESLAAVANALGDPQLSEIRFRSNIAMDGMTAWEEQNWVGRVLRIGKIEFDVVRPKVRCLATHANPRTGERDLPVMQTLVSAFQQKQPTFAVAIVTRGRGGEIRVGDQVNLLT
ncbi:MAG TPA: MOSC domain-containing protein [Burkholderiales bacterium]